MQGKNEKKFLIVKNKKGMTKIEGGMSWKIKILEVQKPFIKGFWPLEAYIVLTL